MICLVSTPQNMQWEPNQRLYNVVDIMHYQIGTENNQNTLFMIIIKCICGVTEILYSQKLLQLIIDLRNSSTEEKSFCTTIAYPDIRREKQPQNVKDVEGSSLWKWYKREGNEFHLFFMSASLRPILGVSTVRIIALNPFLSALCTNIAVKSRLLHTYINKEIPNWILILQLGSE